LDDEQRAEFVDAVFDALEASGAETFREMNDQGWNGVNAVIKAARSMEPERQKAVVDVIRRLAAVGTGAIWDEAKKSLVRVLERGIPGAPRNQAGSIGSAADQITDRSAGQSAGQITGQITDQSAEQGAGQITDQSAEQGADRITDQSAGQSSSGTPDQDAE
ncbi:MAG: hypothetical protein K6C06_10420, partial [Lachnospiraceae bacterium]|nr:hypothetical protein [Lachnospiraceae bacterium]